MKLAASNFIVKSVTISFPYNNLHPLLISNSREHFTPPPPLPHRVLPQSARIKCAPLTQNPASTHGIEYTSLIIYFVGVFLFLFLMFSKIKDVKPRNILSILFSLNLTKKPGVKKIYNSVLPHLVSTEHVTTRLLVCNYK